MRHGRVVFDRGPSLSGAAFQNPSAFIRADAPADVERAFGDMQRAQSEGKWLAGYVSYEFGYLTSSKLEYLLPAQRELPLIHFGVFDQPSQLPVIAGGTEVVLDPLQALWDFGKYEAAFQIVHDYIGAGDIYQANLTFPLASQYTGTLDALCARLRARQPVPHGALVDLGGTALVSRSPELFFALASDGVLTARPMKGTAPRGQTPTEDDAFFSALQTSQKDRAENLMIVDLLRNDMSRVSEVGSVKVPELFDVERFETLHQMTSRITSRVLPGTTIKDLFMALFPCGSVTGAPKVRAMQIIRDLETQSREAYCGSIGWIAPDGSMEFNVAIRTLLCRDDGSVTLNVGGGVVHDSTARGEYAEALLKSRFTHIGEGL